MSKLLYTSSYWTPELLEKTWKVIDQIAKKKYGLTYYPPQIEIVTSQQMIHHSSTSGLPFIYDHWSFGKAFVDEHKEYIEGKTGLAYEMIINSNPAVCYIMENNSMTMQALVLAHAIVGHGSFFKNNGAFKLWTHPESILLYAKFAREYIKECEEKYGSSRVEQILDRTHALQYVGIDRYERTRLKRKEELEKMALERREYEELMHNPLWKTFEKWRNEKTIRKVKMSESDFPWPFPEENLLYFIEKNAPALEDWQREIVHIVRRFSQYFYPQIQTKLMNEGWASFWHYTLMHDLYDGGYINEGHMMEFLESHSAVAAFPSEAKPKFGHINPYALGFHMFKKIRQVCETPSAKDKEEFKMIAGQPWLEVFQDIVENYNDASFVGQFLSSETVEAFKMMEVQLFDKPENRAFKVTHIQDRDRLSQIRRALSDHYSFSSRFPTLEIVDYKFEDDRRLVVRHQPTRGMALKEEDMKECIKYLHKLWGYPVEFHSIDKEGKLMEIFRKNL